ncbi:MAG TPA: DUF948 domain-containing protein [Mycobacteriales bacterium]|nr:DUF948 domain-containing protein [Mycobacteriales bacterium]
MSVGEIAALIAAIAFVLLVGLLAVPILKLGRTLDETTLAIRKAHEGAGPILTNAASTVEAVNSQLERVEDITANAQSVSSNAAALTSLFASTVGGPVVKIAAFSHGIRSAAKNRRVAETKRAAKKVSRAERRAARKAG